MIIKHFIHFRLTYNAGSLSNFIWIGHLCFTARLRDTSDQFSDDNSLVYAAGMYHY